MLCGKSNIQIGGGEGRGGEEGGERKTISKYFKKKIGLV